MNEENYKIIRQKTSLELIPEDIGPRKEQMLLIEQNLEKNNMFLSGNPASGKTTVIKKILEKYNNACYVNAALLAQPQQIFVYIYIHSQGKTVRISAKNAQEQLKKYNKNIIVIIDEVDYLARKPQVIYDLLEIKPNFNLIFIANTLALDDELKSDCTERARSRLQQFVHINFPDYKKEEYIQILQIRINDNLYKLFADRALKILANRNTDLRRFLTDVPRSFLVALERGHTLVQLSDIDAVSAETDVLQSLTWLELHILQCANLGSMTEAEVYIGQKNINQKCEISGHQIRLSIKELHDRGLLVDNGLVPEIFMRREKILEAIAKTECNDVQ